MILNLKIFQRHDISPYHHQHQQTLQNLVDPMNNDVTVLQSDYQRIKKHTPTYQADFAGIFPNLLTNTISNTFDSDEEETISSGTFIRLIYPIQMLLSSTLLCYKVQRDSSRDLKPHTNIF